MRAGFELYRTIEQDRRDNAELAKRKLTIPVLAIGARHGVGERVAQGMLAVAGDVTTLFMEGTGHFIPQERPAALAEIIEDFVAGRPVPSRWAP